MYASFSAFSFNSRTREGCDIASTRSGSWLIRFQFTHPGGVRRLYVRTTKRPTRFNSRTREGCDKSLGRTTLLRQKFQFTHPGGVRPQPLNTAAFVRMFQFTHPGGVRRSVLSVPSKRTLFQFTHPGGVRLRHSPADVDALRFNSRTREGCDRQIFKTLR